MLKVLGGLMAAVGFVAMTVALCVWEWNQLGPTDMSGAGYGALVGGVVVALVLGVALMALIFYSSRRGYDDAPTQRGVGPTIGGLGALLGFLTALTGRQGIWICTAAVEAAVHRHLDDQLGFLATRDRDLHDAISNIRVEELSHLHHAEMQLQPPGLYHRALRALISFLTDLMIWLSTWGDSARMARDLRQS